MNALWRHCRELFQRRRRDRESVDELEHHVALAVAEKVRAGVDEREARRQTRLELGSIDLVREQLAEGRTRFLLEQLAREAMYAGRVLRRAPGPTTLSVATIGLGIAAPCCLR